MDMLSTHIGMQAERALRHGLLMASLLVLASCASSGGRPATNPAEVRPFIRESAIDFPKAVASATLVNHMGLGDVGAGIDLLYRLSDLPEAVFDVFVYPAGQMPPPPALQAGQQAFLATLTMVDAHGSVPDLGVVAQEPFAVRMADGRELPGIKTQLVSPAKGQLVEVVSRAYLFFRQFYYIKARLTAPLSDQEPLDRLGDAAVRELVQKIRVRSRGKCVRVLPMTEQTMPIASQVDVTGTELRVRSPKDLPATLEQMDRAIAGDLGCIATQEWPSIPDGYSRRTLQFKPGDWEVTRR